MLLWSRRFLAWIGEHYRFDLGFTALMLHGFRYLNRHSFESLGFLRLGVLDIVGDATGESRSLDCSSSGIACRIHRLTNLCILCTVST